MDGVSVAPTGTPVSLTNNFNLTGIYADGSTFSVTGGLDGNGNAYSASQLGTSLTWEDVPFDLGTRRQRCCDRQRPDNRTHTGAEFLAAVARHRRER